MEMKEFYYEDGIRVSLFNLDHQSVSYHYHHTVSDMIYCAKGAIDIELPDLQKIYHIVEGQTFQIPSCIKHRFANGMSVGERSRYILLQLGSFDIEFASNSSQLEESLQNIHKVNEPSKAVYIEDRKSDILNVAAQFSNKKPDVLDTEEVGDVITGLRCFVKNGVEAEFPGLELETA